MLHKSARPQTECLGPCVFRYGLVLVTFNRFDGAGLRFGPLVSWVHRESCRALVIIDPLAANVELEIMMKYEELTSPFNAASHLLMC